jgi:hypothetical protein
MAPTFEEREDGNEWCICDVVLYTERPDMVGDLAKKVVGLHINEGLFVPNYYNNKFDSDNLITLIKNENNNLCSSYN